MLDLGCGTGLVGTAFRAQVDHLTGVDLAAGMIEQARRRSLYDRLETAELTAFLAAEVVAGRRYDLVLAADVLVYVRDLSPVVDAVRRVLAPRGLFAFTVETHAGEGVLLRESLRYAHGAACVRAGAGPAKRCPRIAAAANASQFAGRRRRNTGASAGYSARCDNDNAGV